MDSFSTELQQVFGSLDQLWNMDEKSVPMASKIRRTAELIAWAFNTLLLIHPYANGNGHMARFMAVAVFLRYGLRPRRWPINARPADPPYSELIRRYQHGDTEGFIRFLILCL
jgi:hypothetical protein